MTADIGAKSGCFIWAKGQPSGNGGLEGDEGGGEERGEEIAGKEEKRRRAQYHALKKHSFVSESAKKRKKHE